MYFYEYLIWILFWQEPLESSESTFGKTNTLKQNNPSSAFGKGLRL